VTEANETKRFRGFSPETPRFFETLDADPCPDAWPADARVTYAAHVLSPLKALVTDLEAQLGDVAALVALEARVGGSLSWPKGIPTGPEDCPVRSVRAWARGRDPEESPLLFANFSAGDIEIGLSAAGSAPAIDSDDEGRADVVRLLTAGWTVEDESPAGLRVTRRAAWGDWLGEPGFATELADRFRELLPLFERMLVAAPAPSDA
jgi:hypothetical protein